MPSLFVTIESDMKNALKQGRKLEVSTLRLLISELRSAEKTKKTPLDESEILTIIQKQIKRRSEAIEQYKNANRNDLAEKEEKEKLILGKYLPEQLSENELNEIIEKAIKDVRAMSVSDMGKVMSDVMPKVKGRADGKMVSNIVKQKLSSI